MALLSAAGWAAVGSIGLGVYGANQAGNAANAQVNASRDANALQAQTRNMAYTANEPARWTGYQALNDINTLYGYGSAPYTPLAQLTGGGVGGGNLMRDSTAGSNGVITVGAHTSGGNDTMLSSQADMIGLGGLFGHGGGYNYAGGTINPMTGQVTVTDTSGDAQAYNEALSNYLRTGEWTLGDRQTKYLSTVKAQIDQLRSSGYGWDPTKNVPTGPGWTGAGTGTQPGAGSQPGQPGNMSRFFTSPDYTFRRDEGQRGIGNSFAARGGAASGNALRALSEFNSNLASSEFGNYYNRLASLAGMQQTANNQNQQAGQYAASQIGQGLINQGDARASGAMGQYGAILGGLNGAANSLGNYFGNRYSSNHSWQPGPASLPGGGSINPNLPWIGGF
jgi:hypothetical protein